MPNIFKKLYGGMAQRMGIGKTDDKHLFYFTDKGLKTLGELLVFWDENKDKFKNKDLNAH